MISSEYSARPVMPSSEIVAHQQIREESVYVEYMSQISVPKMQKV